MNVKTPPIKRPITTFALRISRTSSSGVPMFTLSANDWNSARAVSAAEPIAKPFPIAAVVFVIAILSNMGRKFYITKKGKAGLSK